MSFSVNPHLSKLNTWVFKLKLVKPDKRTSYFFVKLMLLNSISLITLNINGGYKNLTNLHKSIMQLPWVPF